MRDFLPLLFVSYDIYIYIFQNFVRNYDRVKGNVRVHQGCNSSLGANENEKLENVKASSYPVFIEGGREGNENFVEQSTRLKGISSYKSLVLRNASQRGRVTKSRVVSVHPRVNPRTRLTVDRERDRPVIT